MRNLTIALLLLRCAVPLAAQTPAQPQYYIPVWRVGTSSYIWAQMDRSITLTCSTATPPVCTLATLVIPGPSGPAGPPGPQGPPGSGGTGNVSVPSTWVLSSSVPATFTAICAPFALFRNGLLQSGGTVPSTVPGHAPDYTVDPTSLIATFTAGSQPQIGDVVTALYQCHP